MLQCARTGPGMGWCRVAIASLRMLTTSARFWFWSYNFGIRISRKNVTKSSFHYRFASTSRDVACFIHNKEHAFESGPSDRKQNGGAFFSSDGWWCELSQMLWWCTILCISRVVLMLKAIKCSINTYDRRKYRFFRVVYSLMELTYILHDEISGVVWYCAKNSKNFTVQIFFYQSDENGVFSQFWWFQEKVYFITWIWKW